MIVVTDYGRTHRISSNKTIYADIEGEISITGRTPLGGLVQVSFDKKDIAAIKGMIIAQQRINKPRATQ